MAIFTKETFPERLEIVNIDVFCELKQFEAAVIALPSLRLLVMSIYRTPDSSPDIFTERLAELLDFLGSNNRKYNNFKIVIASDLNIDPRINEKHVRYFLNMLKSYDCYCTNLQPTRISACLDNFITNLHPASYRCEITSPFISDHCGLILKLGSLNNNQASKNYSFETDHAPVTITYRLLNESCIDRLKHNLNKVNWQLFFQSSINVNEAFTLFMNTLSDSVINNCPLKTKVLKNKYNKAKNRKWYTPFLGKIRHLLDISHKKCISDPNLLPVHRRLKQLYREQINLAKIGANDKFIIQSGNQCKAAWTIINSEYDRQTNNTLNTKIPFTANEFNQFFVNVGNNAHPKHVNTNLATSLDMLRSSGIRVAGSPTFKWSSVTLHEIQNIVKGFNNSKSEDVFGLSNFLLKHIIEDVSNPLTYLINWMLNAGTYPECLKVTITVPIHKKGDVNSLNNYRPIALVAVVSKVIETVLRNQLVNYFEHHHLLSSSQFGFRKNLSTIKAVEKMVSFVTNSFEKKEEVSSLLLDLSKAFDLVPHRDLINKLRYYGLQNNALALVTSYLSDRFQIVKLGDQKSNLQLVSTGVPQGSVLGPFLFTVYINDLPSFVPNKSILYADDTTLLTASNNVEINKVTLSYMKERANFWFEANGFVVNEDKTDDITFSLSRFADIDNKSVKLLGITLDGKLNWKAHTNSLCSRLSRVIFCLRRLKMCTSFEVLRTAYFGLFHSHLSYGTLLWGNSSGSREVFKCQKKAIRSIVGIGNMESCRPFFVKLEILTLPCIFIYQSLVYVKENLDLLTLRSQIHSHNTRSHNKIDIRHVRLTKTQQAYYYTGANIFNRLSSSAATIDIKRFKSVLNKWLKSKAFYSLDEMYLQGFDDLRF